MSFLHLPVLIVGALCVAAPVILHFMMRRKPREVVFPALRFVKKRQVVNQRSLQLRHLALLALRCLAVFAAATAFARPIVSSTSLGAWLLVGASAIGALVTLAVGLAAWQRRLNGLISFGLLAVAGLLAAGSVFFVAKALGSESGLPSVDSEAPVAAVLLFDTSPRMALIQESQSRLAAAQELGRALLRQLPRDSEVAIMDTRIGGSSFAVDRSAAATEIQALETGYVAQTLPRMIESAGQLLTRSTLERREMYIFTDLTEPSWDSTSGSIIQQMLDSEAPPHFYVLDVGIPAPRNLSLGDLVLSRNHLARNAELRLDVEVLSAGISDTRTIELFVESPDPQLPVIVDGKPKTPPLRLRSQREVEIQADQPQSLASFSLRGLDIGTHHGQVSITGEDGLAVDDVRYFTFEVHPPWPLLVTAGEGANPNFFIDALSPYQFRETGQALFECELIKPSKIASVDLSKYATVALLDPGEISDGGWQNLANFTATGNGLAIFLGRNVARHKEQFESPLAKQVLPAQPARVFSSGADEFQLSLGSAQHPILDVLKSQATSIPWSQFPIKRHWSVKDLAEQTRTSVILRYGNGKPALLESTNGGGRILMMTTPVSDPLNIRGRKPWNRGTDSWPYFVIVNEIMKYLAQGSSSSLNYDVGQAATLAYRNGEADRYQLFHPRGSWQEVNVVKRALTVSFSDMPGQYRLKSSPPGQPTRGFSVNLSPNKTRLDRIETDRLDEIFGEGRYQLARDESSINRQIGVARRGHEFYPWVLLIVVLALGLEHLLSNRFYGTGGPSAQTATSSPSLSRSKAVS